MDHIPHEPANLFPRRVGEKLADARRARALELTEVAAQTRIPLRHLEAIERADHASLPATPYSTGFVRSYARLVGLDGTALAQEFRNEIGQDSAPRPLTLPFEPADPKRVPSRLLALIALAVAMILAASYGAWRSGWLTGESAEQRARSAAGTQETPQSTATTPLPPPPAGAPAPATAAGGPVVLTAIAPVWLRVSEGDHGAKLIEKQLAPGETFAVPPTAVDPRLLTGRPEAVRVTVGTTVIPPLGTPAQTIRNVSLKADALLARPTAPAPAAAAPAAAPTSSVPAAPPPASITPVDQPAPPPPGVQGQ